MNLFARILSHGFALVVVALLAIGLVYRGELFPEWELPEFLSPGQEPAAGTASQEADAGRSQVSQPQPQGEPRSSADTAPGTQPGMMPSTAIDRSLPASAATGAADEEIQAMHSGGEEATGTANEPAGAGMAASGEETDQTSPPAAEPEPVAQQPETEAANMAAGEPAAGEAAVTGEFAEATPVTTFDTGTEGAPAQEDITTTEGMADTGKKLAEPTVTPYRLLAAAREAYWLRDYAVAELKYRELIALDPDNPDGYGELGNMYFSQGDWDKASASYYEAGLRLSAQGMYDRARQLVEVIRGLDGKQAGDLERQIDAAESAAP